MMESSWTATEGSVPVRCNRRRCAPGDVLLPISIALAEACYAFQKCIVPYLVGNEFGWMGSVEDSNDLSQAILRRSRLSYAFTVCRSCIAAADAGLIAPGSASVVLWRGCFLSSSTSAVSVSPSFGACVYRWTPVGHGPESRRVSMATYVDR